MTTPLNDQEFALFQRFIFDAAGITLPDSKKALVSGRLAKRLHFFQLESYSEYFHLLHSGHNPAELQMAIDLLTTNETYFFRESKHFDLLRQQAKVARGRTAMFRVWSAASSSGEEAYSIAMVLADVLGTETPWEVVGSDISTKVLRGAARAHYSMERGRNIPTDYLRQFCLRGTQEYHDTLLIDRSLRQKVHFRQLNLNATLPQLGLFDIVFLRNVMIYFNDATKREVVARVITAIKPGGYFLIGHAESLNDITHEVQPLAPSIYRKKP
ncbi:MAG: protein-glutamate O-methyltransferase CheR [Burkholderiaceae bacterium]|nr:protein-glutamate O-methyltransferase CheR [Burkholderiaceae bacterium]